MRLVVGILLCGGGIFGILFGGYYHYQEKETSYEMTIEVAPGSSLRRVLEQDFSYPPLFLKIYFSLYPDAQMSVFPGEFFIPEHAKIHDILAILSQSPSTPLIQVQILEGWNIYDIDVCLSHGTCISGTHMLDTHFSEPGAFVESVHDMEKWQQKYLFLAGKKSLEGFLYPDTYFLAAGSGIEDIIEEQLKNYERKILPLFTHLSDVAAYDTLILASIVEKEERNPKEKPKVAGILKKRWEA